jgi:TRAP-type mannitol/chloroaromatic compound transport system permease small subunit
MTALLSICRAIEGVNRIIGKGAAWLVLFMMLVQFGLVLMRYVFGTGSLLLHEAIIYAYGILFMMAAAWTLAEDRHVRVDIFYGSASPRRKAMIDLFGVAVFLLPMCVLVWWVGFPYVARSWAVWEGSREITGIPAIFLLKTFILLFAVTLALQGVAMGVRAAATLSGHSPAYGPRRKAAGQDAG